MSKWIEENNDHILEGHGAKFVVVRVLYSKQHPSKWTIKQSPFLLDVHKKFATLGEAKEYCEQRYQELFGKLDEITRLRADLAAVTAERDALLAHLAPVDDDILREIAAMHFARIDGHSDNWDRYVDEAKDYIDAIRPHIEAAERERCAKIADKHEHVWHDELAHPCARAIAAAIRSGK